MLEHLPSVKWTVKKMQDKNFFYVQVRAMTFCEDKRIEKDILQVLVKIAEKAPENGGTLFEREQPQFSGEVTYEFLMEIRFIDDDNAYNFIIAILEQLAT